tara:strand:- start:591 stop:773 length:183 start_codon:yes stop_codon:yes gene_type:complete
LKVIATESEKNLTFITPPILEPTYILLISFLWNLDLISNSKEEMRIFEVKKKKNNSYKLV